MNLHRLLAERQAKRGRPVRIGLIGCGKFASMFLAQARRTVGLQVAVIADLAPAKAKANLARIFWPAEQYGASSAEEAARTGATFVTDDAGQAIGARIGDVLRIGDYGLLWASALAWLGIGIAVVSSALVTRKPQPPPAGGQIRSRQD